MKHIRVQCFKNGKEGQLPADGTINRGFEPMNMRIPEGYELAKANLKSPLIL
jgi:hypothetical protein